MNVKHVVVVGGGIVGLTTAWSLLQQGLEVSLLEREAGWAMGASHANGGQLSYRYVSPLADGGVPLKALRWLLEPDGPLRFKPEWTLHQWRWLCAFLSHCRGSVNRRTTQRLLALGVLSQQAFARLQAQTGMRDVALRVPGKLVLYRSGAEFSAVAARLRADPHAVEQVLDARACQEVEPALTHSPVAWAGGIFTQGEAVADCYQVALHLGQALHAHAGFRGHHNTNAQGLAVRQDRVVGVHTENGMLEADAIVLAAGLQSRALALSVGIRLPLYPLKGYSLTATIDAGHHAPQVSVTDAERKVLYAQIGSSLRVAAMADLVGEDLSLDRERVASLHRVVQATFPHAARYAGAHEWAGLRPATPSGAPILGPTSLRGLWLNTGHGALGFTMSFGSAEIVAALITGRTSPIPLHGLQYGA